MAKAVPLMALIGMFFLLAVARPAQAGFVATEDLQRSCMSGKNDQVMSCLSYIAGVIDYHILMQSFGTQPTIDFCLPDKLTLEDAGVAVMAYLKSHPQHDAIASAIVPMALNDAFPCHPRPVKKKSTATSASHRRKH